MSNDLIAPQMSTLQNFFHLLLRLLVALLVSHFIVVHDAKETWMELFTKDYYYFSVLYSMIIAFLLIECVYRVTNYLNNFLGFSLSRERLKAQFFKGFAFTGVLAFALAAVLFWLNGQNIFESNYFEKLYASILLFIFTVNVFYMLYYFYSFMPKTRYQVLRIDQYTLNNETSNQPALIFLDNRLCIAIDFRGVKSYLNHSIEESMRLLDPENYFQINRRVIVHRAAISSIKPFGVRQLKIKLNLGINIPKSAELIVSKRKMVLCKQWLTSVDN